MFKDCNIQLAYIQFASGKNQERLWKQIFAITMINFNHFCIIEFRNDKIAIIRTRSFFINRSPVKITLGSHLKSSVTNIEKIYLSSV